MLELDRLHVHWVFVINLLFHSWKNGILFIIQRSIFQTQASSRTNNYALNSAFVSSTDSSTEIENNEIFPANIRHDLRNSGYSKQDLDIAFKPDAVVCRNYFEGCLRERRIRERCSHRFDWSSVQQSTARIHSVLISFEYTDKSKVSGWINRTR